jgi:hypothetical protein
MQVQRAWLKAGVWGAVVGSIFTMIVGFNWEGGLPAVRRTKWQ